MSVAKAAETPSRAVRPACPHGLKTWTGQAWLCLEGVCNPEKVRPGLRVVGNGPVAPPAAPVEPVEPVEVPQQREPVERAVGKPVVEVVAVGRLPWLELLAFMAVSRTADIRYADAGMGLLFTQGHFDYATGCGTNHQSASYLALRAGISERSVTAYLARLRAAGLLAVVPGSERSFGFGTPTPLYRLTAPAG